MAAKAAAAKAAVKKVAAVEGSDTDEVVSESKPGFVWTPKDGGEPIVLPHVDTVRPKGKTMWFEYQMNKRSHSFVAQIAFAMQCGDVPAEVQDRLFELPDEELLEFVTAWSSTLAGGATPGES